MYGRRPNGESTHLCHPASPDTQQLQFVLNTPTSRDPQMDAVLRPQRAQNEV